jgi:CheY-like chemotaxis protein
MPIISLVHGSHCHGEEIGARVSRELNAARVEEGELIAETAGRLRVAEDPLRRTLDGRASVFNPFSRERERNLAGLRLTVADRLAGDGFMMLGRLGHLIPSGIGHVLKVCVIAEMDARVERAMRALGLPRKEAQKRIRREDESLGRWTDLLRRRLPWDAALYDMLLPTSKLPPDEAVRMIVEHARSRPVERTPASVQAVRDFQLAARAETALVQAGHEVEVSARDGCLILTVNRHTLRLEHLEAELKAVASRVEGVREVETRVGPGFYQAVAYRQLDAAIPRRVLLVDDEQEFVQTLSERLSMRDVGTAAVHDGEAALKFVREEEVPEVMVLDLKMPGIDGLEVLKRIKAEHPGVEVIVLTGHGTPQDEAACRALGAFAYLQKPVDIEKLSETMKAAYRRLRARQGESPP